MKLFLIKFKSTTHRFSDTGRELYPQIEYGTCYDVGVDMADVLSKHPATSVHPNISVEVYAVPLGKETLEGEIEHCKEIIRYWRVQPDWVSSLKERKTEEALNQMRAYKALLVQV